MSFLLLPHEVIDYIVQFLPLSDRTAVARTCHTLYNCCLVGTSRRGKKLGVTMLEDVSRGFDALKYSQQTVHRVAFRSASLQKEHVRGWDTFWDNLGPGITELTFESCDISERTFCDILFRCPNLESLTADGCNSLFMSGKLLDRSVGVSLEALVSLRELDLNNNRYLSDALFNRLTSFTPNVVRMSLAGCQISFHPAIYKRFYPQNGLRSIASESVLTFQNVVKFFERHSSKLKSLDFSNTPVDDSALKRLCVLPDLRLEELRLVNCQQVSVDGIGSVCAHQRDLKVLDVTKCSKIVDDAVLNVTHCLTKLKTLNLGTCRSLTADGIVDLGKLPFLSDLNLSECESIYTSGFQASLCSNLATSLVSLNLSASNLSEDTVVALASCLTRLRDLDLSNCRKGVTDTSLQSICRHLRWLRTLKLAWCNAITDVGLKGSDGEENNSKKDDDQTALLFSLSNIRGLRKLDLCACSEITDSGLKESIRFKELNSLNLSLCHKITDSGLVSIGACNGSLENLVLSQCREITDVGVVALVKCLPRLKHLDLQGCRKIGQPTLDALKHWCPELHYLDVSVCPAVTLDSLESLEATLSRLHINKRHLQANGLNTDTFRFHRLS